MHSATEALARYATTEHFDRLPAPVVEKAKRCLLDSLGCSFGGSRTNVGSTMVALATLMGGNPISNVLGTAMKTSPTMAALVNSTTANALDFDDTCVGHPGATVVPPALAVAQHRQLSGKDLITSIVIGYEVSTRVGLSIQPSPERFNKVWGLGTYQVFGAVSAAGRLLNLDQNQMASAFGIAGSNSPVPSVMKTVLDPLGKATMVKNNYGMSSLAGIVAAYLARENFVGPSDILDGDQGFWVMAGSDRCNFGSMTQDLGTDYRILNVSFKFYPACRWLHSAIDGALQILREHNLTLDDVQDVVIKTNSVLTKSPYDNVRPENMTQAQFSLPYCVAVAMSGMAPGPDWFSAETLRNTKVLALADKIRLERDDESDRIGRIDEVLSTVEIHAAGSEFSQTVRYAKGHPRNSVSLDEHNGKFESLAGPAVGPEKAQSIIRCIERIEEIPDIAELTRFL